MALSQPRRRRATTETTGPGATSDVPGGADQAEWSDLADAVAPIVVAQDPNFPTADGAPWALELRRVEVGDRDVVRCLDVPGFDRECGRGEPTPPEGPMPYQRDGLQGSGVIVITGPPSMSSISVTFESGATHTVPSVLVVETMYAAVPYSTDRPLSLSAMVDGIEVSLSL
jgi:hypothetical protein